MESNSFEDEKIEFSHETQELGKKYLTIIKRDPIGASEKIADFVRGALWKNHTIKELHNYEAYCIVVGSTPDKKPEYFDLEGDESIVRFIDTLAEKTENGTREN